jgi:hypothetical protein
MKAEKISVGMLVDYHSLIGGPVTKPACRVTSDPFDATGGSGRRRIFVVFIDQVRGYVSCEALTPAAEQKAPTEARP